MADLDLIELRCRLRGWTSARYNEDPSDPEPFAPHVVCDTPDGLVTVYADGQFNGPCVEIKVAHDNRRGFGKRTRFDPRSIQALTAPRWTLDRLLSEPPEGWKGMGLQYGYVYGVLAWEWDPQTDDRSITAALYHSPAGGAGVRIDIKHTDDLARLAERHKAAAELALILAEVGP